MPTTRFLPGDRVQVKPRSAAVLGFTTNSTHTVAHVDDFGQLALRGGSSYYHPSHFELVERAVPDETYCLLDGDGDWWVADGTDRFLVTPRGTYPTKVTPEEAAAHYGIDAEPLPAMKGYEPTHAEVDEVPEPLKEGDWVQVWAQMDRTQPDTDGDLTLTVPMGGGKGESGVYVRPDAIVRPDAGQVPPWVKEPERKEVQAIAAALQREGGMSAGAALQMAESLHRAGVRAEVTER